MRFQITREFSFYIIGYYTLSSSRVLRRVRKCEMLVELREPRLDGFRLFRILGEILQLVFVGSL